MATPLAAFGPGIAIIRRTDIANGPIVNVGYVNEMSIDFSGTTKELFGQNQYPLVAARGTVKSTGKWKSAVISGIAWNHVFFGQTFTAGTINWTIGESQVIPATPFTVTVTNATNFDADLGVTYAATGLPGQRVTAGAEAAGKYSVTESGVNKGKYIFAAADTGLTVLITYSTTVAAIGQQLLINNTPIGFTPTFQLDYYTNLNQPLSKPFIVRCYGCVSSKIALAAKLEDYIMPEFDFDMFADNSNRVVNFAYPEVS